MDEKEKANADIFVKLYERQMSHYENTQGIEWKVNIGVWTLLVVAIGWASQNPIVTGCSLWVVGIGLAFFAAAHGLWLWLIHSSEEADKDLWLKYRCDAVALARGNASTATAKKPEPEPAAKPEPASSTGRTKLRSFLWLASELTPTIVLATALLVALATWF